jgi:hypothetical protein
MFHGRSIIRVSVALAAITLTFGALSSAHGATAGVTAARVTAISGNADFGNGSHFNGIPGLGTITWDYTPDNGVVVVTARVRGRLYLDRLGSGCARLRIHFQDGNFNNIFSPQPLQFCGPGFDANNAFNQLAVDVTSFPDPTLRRVQLVVGSGPTIGSIIDEQAATFSAVAVNTSDVINNGNADLGNPIHVGGTPLNPATISLRLLTDGRISGDVNGVLFWDSFSAGCARLEIRFRDIDNVNLTAVRVRRSCGGTGGNALLNQAIVDEVPFNDARLFRINLRVGTENAARTGFVGNVTSRTYSFGADVGLVEGIPGGAFAAVREDIAYGIEWTVPDPANWHSLDILDVRLRDENGDILHVRWDESANTFSQLKPRTGRFTPPALPGTRTRFHGDAVTLFLKHSEVIGSGPTGPSVLLNLHLRFKPQAAGRTFTVEVLARDDAGNVQDWDVAGTITVVPRHHNDDTEGDDD